jgi:SAM-dependent methyltransferase
MKQRRRDLPMAADATREQVRERYGKIASEGSCCTPGGSSEDLQDGSCGRGCGPGSMDTYELGYSHDELAALPRGANLGLGCGNPTALLSLKAGQVVLDLGSGAGIDCFLAAKRVGPKGHAIGVDMTPEMLAKARENARQGGFTNVEFRLGEIEHLPVADASVDVVISNCVINLVPDKAPVYREAFRVLRPGGRLAVSDMVATRPISDEDRANPALWGSCSSGALEGKEIEALLKRAGFEDIHVDLKSGNGVPDSLQEQDSLGVVSADIRATKPKR